jgi:hypothetical protein
MATIIITDEGALEVNPDGGALLVDADALASVTGWKLEPQGLCRGDVCVPTRARPEIRVGDQVDARVFADLLRRPLAFDDDAGVGVLGESAATRAEQLASMRVDDFALADVDGRPFRWSSIGRRKKVLVAWASW